MTSFRPLLKQESVYSWRGPIEKGVPHAFTREYFEVLTGDFAPIWTCTPTQGFVDGGPTHGFMPTIPTWANSYKNEPLRVAIPWGFDVFKATDLVKLSDYSVQKLFAKANAPDFALATFLAELGESVRYVLERLTKILFETKKVVFVVRGLMKQPKTKNMLREINDFWLEWRYAILPLLLDIENIRELIKGKTRKAKVRSGISDGPILGATYHRFGFDNWDSSYTDPYWVFRNKTTTTIRGGSGFQTVFRYDPTPFGTSLWDVIQAGWERVPLSFVFDWFLDIGQWLESWRNTGLEIRGGFSSVVVEVNGEVMLDRTENCSIIHAIGVSNEPPIKYYGFKHQRFLFDAPPSLPQVVPLHLKWFRQLDAAALIIGVLNRFRH
jgi:hypothetical protein